MVTSLVTSPRDVSHPFRRRPSLLCFFPFSSPTNNHDSTTKSSPLRAIPSHSSIQKFSVAVFFQYCCPLQARAVEEESVSHWDHVSVATSSSPLRRETSASDRCITQLQEQFFSTHNRETFVSICSYRTLSGGFIRRSRSRPKPDSLRSAQLLAAAAQLNTPKGHLPCSLYARFHSLVAKLC